MAVQAQVLAAWTVNNHDDIKVIRLRCRRLVTRRALISAAAAVVPLPGVDLAVDIGVLLRTIDDINAAFGLTPAQIERLSPRRKAFAYQAISVVGSALIGRILTRDLMLRALARFGLRLSAGQVAKYVPLAGQALAATISFSALKVLGDRHVDDCARVAGRLIATDPGPPIR